MDEEELTTKGRGSLDFRVIQEDIILRCVLDCPGKEPDLTEIHEMTTTSTNMVVSCFKISTTESMPMESELGAFVVVDARRDAIW
ncbi:hypothetical protein PAMP_000970 [Pampus punctatissimus]